MVRCRVWTPFLGPRHYIFIFYFHYIFQLGMEPQKYKNQVSRLYVLDFSTYIINREKGLHDRAPTHIFLVYARGWGFDSHSQGTIPILTKFIHLHLWLGVIESRFCARCVFGAFRESVILFRKLFENDVVRWKKPSKNSETSRSYERISDYNNNIVF